jgi:hypothetical protein
MIHYRLSFCTISPRAVFVRWSSRFLEVEAGRIQMFPSNNRVLRDALYLQPQSVSSPPTDLPYLLLIPPLPNQIALQNLSAKEYGKESLRTQARPVLDRRLGEEVPVFVATESGLFFRWGIINKMYVHNIAHNRSQIYLSSIPHPHQPAYYSQPSSSELRIPFFYW